MRVGKFLVRSGPAGMMAGFLMHALFFRNRLHAEYLFLLSLLWIGVAVLVGATVLGIYRDLRGQSEDLARRVGR